LRVKPKSNPILDVVLLLICLVVSTSDNSLGDEDSKYLDAVCEFADSVLKYGRDTYGPKHTPLFVDGLNIHTHEPVKWISPEGEKWVLSNLASQQNLFRTLDGLTTITGDPKYKQAAMDAIKYAFKNLRTPNGLLYWGGHMTYDALADQPRLGPIGRHELKMQYPYYELMWQVDPDATKRFIGAFWSAHIRDWSNLDMGRHGNIMRLPSEPWKHEYKGGPVFFEPPRGPRGSFICAGSNLFHGAASLTKLSGDSEPLVWAKRLAYRYVETRDPNTGIAAYRYTGRRAETPTLQKMKAHGFNVFGYDCSFPFMPTYGNSDVRRCWYGYCMAAPGIPFNASTRPWICALLVGEMMGSDGKEFIQWSLEELTAWGKVAYRKSDNSWIPMFRNGICLEGLVIKRGTAMGPEGTVVEPIPCVPADFWAYALTYRLTEDDFIWQMARNIALGNGFGDIGDTSGGLVNLRCNIDCVDPYALMGLLELHKKTRRGAFLESSKQIGDNILANRFYRGLFTPSKKHLYTRLDSPEALALLHLFVDSMHYDDEIPVMWPSQAFFEFVYRHKDRLDDTGLIYTLTESPEPPISLNEAAAMGDLDLVKSLIGKGAKVNRREDSFFKTPLHRAAMSGHIEVVKVLLAKGADIDARDSDGYSALHHAAEEGRVEVVELLIDKSADVNASNRRGISPLDLARRRGFTKIAELLRKYRAKE